MIRCLFGNSKKRLSKKWIWGVILSCSFVLLSCGKVQEQADEQIKENNQKEETVLNMECFDTVKGEYRIQGCESEDDNVYVAGYWMLVCFENEDGPYLSIYDCGAGNPGVEGYITAMDEKTINVAIDPDYYEELPKANWADQGGILYLQYELTGEGILLYNGGKETVLEGVRVYPEDE